jgi:hypothetical protein
MFMVTLLFIDFHSFVVDGMNHHYYSDDDSDFDSCAKWMICVVVVVVVPVTLVHRLEMVIPAAVANFAAMSSTMNYHCLKHVGQHRDRYYGSFVRTNWPSLFRKFPILHPIFLVAIDNGVVGDDRNTTRIRLGKMDS